MTLSIEELVKENRVLYHFQQINQVPRGSKQEQQISDYLLNWAKSLGLDAHQDDMLNVFIEKPAHHSRTDAKPILLQAHMDMVWAKKAWSTHDFLHDPIPLKVEGDWLFSAVGTTLGADCGIGVALIMAILEDLDLVHPPIQAIFTTREETDMQGSLTVDPKMIRARRMVNLDTSPDNRVLCGGCGGSALAIHLRLKYQPIPAGYKAYTLTLSGMRGGHSGANIHKGHGNALVLLCRVLAALQSLPIYLADLHSGLARAAIPTDAQALIAVAPEQYKIVAAICRDLHKEFCREYEQSEDVLRLDLIEAEVLPEKVIVDAITSDILDIALISPNGITEMSALIPNSVVTSNNTGVVQIQDDEIVFINEIRSSYSSALDMMLDRLKRIADRCYAYCTSFDRYPPWPYLPTSPLRDQLLEIYKRQNREDMEVIAAHSGCEVGSFIAKIPNMDAVAFGPTRINFHTPDECLNIPSVTKTWNLLKGLLEALT